MKRSSVKELLIFFLWLLTDIFGISILFKCHLFDYVHVFHLAVILLFEAYIFFQLPGAQYFWDAVEHRQDPKHRKIRLAAMACFVSFLIFILKWHLFFILYFIATVRIDSIINFCRVPLEEKFRIFENISVATFVVILGFIFFMLVAFLIVTNSIV